MKPERLKEIARETGFDAAGVAPVALLSEEVGHLREWVAAGKHAGMAYMARNTDVREDPCKLVEGARSVIVTLTNYYSAAQQPASVPRIALYARGKDYHLVVKKRLYALLDRIREEDAGAAGRCFVDSAPVLEHAWAVRAGLGWLGKNTLLIRRGLGSFVFIGVIVTTAEFDRYDEPELHTYCGTCNRCVEACPTGALTAGEVDARRCVSYQTIENKGEYPADLRRLAAGRIFGCDACQEVCPWNQRLTEHRVPEFAPDPRTMRLSRDDWMTMDEERFRTLFQDSPLQRTGLVNVQRNIEF